MLGGGGEGGECCEEQLHDAARSSARRYSRNTRKTHGIWMQTCTVSSHGRQDWTWWPCCFKKRAWEVAELPGGSRNGVHRGTLGCAETRGGAGSEDDGRSEGT